MKFISSIITAALLLFSVSARADVVAECNGCAGLQKLRTAQAYAPGTWVWVPDYVNVTLDKYEIWYDRDLRKNQAAPLPVTDADMTAFLAMAQYRLNYPLVGRIQQTATDPDHTVYDVVTTTSTREAIGVNVANYLRGGHTGNPLIDGLKTILDQAAFSTFARIGTNITVEVTVVFKDGTSAVYVLDRDHLNRAEYKQGSARDKDGNLVPDASNLPGQPNQAGLPGRYVFRDSYSLERWLLTASMWGIQIVDPGASSGHATVDYFCEIKDGKAVCTRLNS